MNIEMTFLMEPVSKGRPRVMRTKGGKSITYTPTKTAMAENLIRAEVVGCRESFPKDVPLHMTAIFYRTRPKHLKKSVLYPTTRPDLDNYFKLLIDALQGFLFIDDSQIVSMNTAKLFGSPPRIELEITEVQD